MLAKFLQHFEEVLRLDFISRVRFARRGQQRKISRMWCYQAVDERFVETLPLFNHVCDRILRLQSEKKREITGLKIEIDEHGFRSRGRRQVCGDERSAATALARKHGDHATFFRGSFDLLRTEL